MTEVVAINETILVVGGGISGMTAALEAAETGKQVVLVEKRPYLGGRVSQLYKYFPKLCFPTCGLEINQRRARMNPNLRVLTIAEVTGIKGDKGNYTATVPAGNLLSVTGVTPTVTLPNNPGGFAYVPAGSPGFAAQSIIVAEWRQSGHADDRVAVYEADAQGDPIIATRREFMSAFPRPWGAYFEPVTGDYLFLSWGLGTDRVYVVQGFVPPPPVL